jgi:hypothetical protein
MASEVVLVVIRAINSSNNTSRRERNRVVIRYITPYDHLVKVVYIDTSLEVWLSSSKPEVIRRFELRWFFDSST